MYCNCSVLTSLPNVHAVIAQRSSKPSLFPSESHFNIPHGDGDGDDVDLDGADLTEFHINAIPSFLTFGHMIELIYAKSTQVTSYLTTKLSLSNICDINNVNVDSDNATAATATTTMNLSKPKSHNFDESCAAAPPSPSAAAAAVCNSQPIMLSTSPIQVINGIVSCKKKHVSDQISIDYFEAACKSDSTDSPEDLRIFHTFSLRNMLAVFCCKHLQNDPRKSVSCKKNDKGTNKFEGIFIAKTGTYVL